MLFRVDKSNFGHSNSVSKDSLCDDVSYLCTSSKLKCMKKFITAFGHGQKLT